MTLFTCTALVKAVAIRAITPDFELRETLAADARLLSLLAVAAVLLALVGARLRLRALFAVVSALALIFVFLWLSLGALRIPLTLVTLLVVPFVLGIGIDAAVYLVERDAFTHDRAALCAACSAVRSPRSPASSASRLSS